MGAECCSATSNQQNIQIMVEKTQQNYDDQPDQQMKKQIQKNQQQENQIKTKFYGTAGVSGSKTMTTQKYSKIQTLANKQKNNIFKNTKTCQRIKQQQQQDQITKDIKKQSNQIPTINIIQQEAQTYLDSLFNKYSNQTQ